MSPSSHVHPPGLDVVVFGSVPFLGLEGTHGISAYLANEKRLEERRIATRRAVGQAAIDYVAIYAKTEEEVIQGVRRAKQAGQRAMQNIVKKGTDALIRAASSVNLH